MYRSRATSVVLLSLLFVVSCKHPAPPEPAAAPKQRRIEGYPARLVGSITNPPPAPAAGTGHSLTPIRFQQVVSSSRRWAPGSIITVAFLGGTPELRHRIMAATTAWTDIANIKFDFGPSANSGQFRQWTESDTTYTADIRIAFTGGDDGGYWSAVGRDSIKPSLNAPHQASMNFEGFDCELPSDWQATVIHEFGHALGFEHEHQSPIANCENEFRWDNDQGYVSTTNSHGEYVVDSQGRAPGIYTRLEGPENNWKKAQIDFNLRKLAFSTDYILSSFDKTSIMEYHFESWMYRDGAASSCYTPQENTKLSAGDIDAVHKAYPHDDQNIKLAVSEKKTALQYLIQMTTTTKEDRSLYRADLRAIQHGKRTE